MRVIIFGASGMVGKGVLLECLDDPGVEAVLVVGRSPCGVTHDTLTEVLHDDFFDLSPLQDRFTGLDACFFCLGVSAAGLSEPRYRRLTYDLTLHAARTLLASSPAMTFCYVSGAGTDRSERGRMMWARVKGATENALIRLGFGAAFMFRPGYIQPLRGITSKTLVYRIPYAVLSPFYPLLKRLLPAYVTATDKVGRAMIRVARDGHDQPIIENAAINELAGGG